MCKIRRFTSALILGVFLSLLSTPLVRAGIPVGDDLVIIDDPEAEVYPAVAYNPDRREYLVVWHNDRPGNDDIQARLITEDGMPLGDPFYISAEAGYEQRHPDVVYNPQEHQYLIAWERFDTAFPTECIALRRLSETGQLLDTVKEIYCLVIGPNTDLGWPALAYASTPNQYLVVWHEFWSTKVSIWGMIISNAGEPGNVYTLSEDPGNNARYNPDVAYNRNRNEFLVVWEQWNNVSGDDDIYARRVRGDGVPMQPESIEIVTGGIGTRNQRRAAVASIPTEDHQGQYLVVWEDHFAPDDVDIWARRVSGEGATDDPQFPISVAEGNQHSPSVAGKESSRNYLVVWSHQEAGILNTYIHGVELTSEGGFSGEERALGVFSSENPTVASGLLDYLILYDDILPTRDNSDIFGHLWGNRIYLPVVRR